jgi:hypothetical protein
LELAKAKKTTVNLFIDEDVIEQIRNESIIKEVSLNARINTILAKYTNFYRRIEELRALIIVPRQWLVFLDMLDENKTIETMKHDGNASMIAHFKHNKIPITKDALIKLAFEKLSLWTGMCCKFNQYVDELEYRHLIFDHEFNIKWSRIASSVFSDLIRVALQLPTEVSIRPNTFEIKIMEREI